MEDHVLSRIGAGGRACDTVKVGNVIVVGSDPVVNVSGAEVVPSFRTYLMRYVVSGSMPATMKLVLSPGTMGSGAVLLQDRAEPCLANSTYIEVPGDGGAVEGDQGVGHGADHRAGPYDPRRRRIGRACGLAGRGAVAVLDGHLNIIGALLQGVPREGVAGAEVTNHVRRTARQSDLELVDRCRPVAAGRRRPDDRRLRHRGRAVRCPSG